MTAPEAFNYLWQMRSAILIFLLPAVAVALFGVPEYLRHGQVVRIRFLKTIFLVTSLLLVVPCLISLADERPFWDALLIPKGVTSRRIGSFVWGLIAVCCSLIFLAAELVKRLGSSSTVEKS